ncbi:Integrase, partial [Pseudomonas coronafaciens pv. zizaniae]
FASVLTDSDGIERSCMMVPRPRNKSNKGLPQNLYMDDRRGTYRYRRPTDGKWFQFGTDRVKAVDAAKQLNLAFIRGRSGRNGTGRDL